MASVVFPLFLFPFFFFFFFIIFLFSKKKKLNKVLSPNIHQMILMQSSSHGDVQTFQVPSFHE